MTVVRGVALSLVRLCMECRGAEPAKYSAELDRGWALSVCGGWLLCEQCAVELRAVGHVVSIRSLRPDEQCVTLSGSVPGVIGLS